MSTEQYNFGWEKIKHKIVASKLIEVNEYQG